MGDLHVTVSGEPFARNVVRLLNVIEGVYNNTYVMFRATPGITLGELRLNLAGAEDKVPEQAPLTVVRVTRIQSYQIVVTGDWTTLAIITAAIGATIHCGRKLAEAIKAGVEIPKAIAETNKIKAETKRIEAETKKTERDANKTREAKADSRESF